jgi:hypothetical protein
MDIQQRRAGGLRSGTTGIQHPDKIFAPMPEQVAGRPRTVQRPDKLWRRPFTGSRHTTRQSRHRVRVVLEGLQQPGHNTFTLSFDDTINGPLTVFKYFVSHE